MKWSINPTIKELQNHSEYPPWVQNILTSQLRHLQNILLGFLVKFDFMRISSSPHAQEDLRDMEEENEDFVAEHLFIVVGLQGTEMSSPELYRGRNGGHNEIRVQAAIGEDDFLTLTCKYYTGRGGLKAKKN
ncbi:protein FAR1-RELATED SEQUENCE 5-like [Sesbania bispinosa]|nr:protein FAR1-RELATED SEQUENCE 5-like [Sesbania bispinosa]